MAKSIDYKPKYLMVMEHLKERIINGRYKQGEALPSQLNLTKKYGVALGTIRQSLAGLANEGWIRPEPGRGFFVQEPQKNNGIKETQHKSSQLGFVWWYDISNEPISRAYLCMMHAAAGQAKEHKTELVYAQFNPNSDEDNEKLAQFITRFEGVIVTGKVDVEKLHDIAKPNNNKVVVAGVILGSVEQEHFSIFDADIQSAGYLAVQHLFSFGHRRLALINESGSLHFSGIQKGFESACRQSGLPKPKVFIVNDVRNEMNVDEKIGEAADDIVADHDTTAIVVTGNVNAEVLIHQLARKGCFVPNAKSVISISGVPRGEMALKNISQILLPCNQVGVESAKFLLNGSSKIVHKSLPVRIEYGQTVLSLNHSAAEAKAKHLPIKPVPHGQSKLGQKANLT